jgi:quinol monooxygenase YgiN
MSEQLTVVVRIKAKRGKEEHVKQELTKLLAPTRAEPGCINFDLHQAAEDTSLFLVHENWASEEDLNRHFEMAYLRAWLDRAQSLLDAQMQLTRWRKIA